MSGIRRPIRKVGARAERWADWQLRQRAAVGRRCRGRCELCKAGDVRLDWHHAVGRGHLVEEPFASWAPLTTALCRPCHERVHLEPEGDAARTVREAAVRELWDTVPTGHPAPSDVPPLDVIRRRVEELEAAGFRPTGAPE